MDVKIYVDGKPLNVYKDETINITSKLQDIEKLSNVFNDYSNQFTVPADDINNAIFKHYYDGNLDNGVNANIKIPAYIEVNTLPFKFGYVQLQSVTIKDNKPDNYKILFFGGLKQLSELFGDDTLDKLDYDKDDFGNLTKVRTDLSQFDMQYTSGDLINSINLPTYMDGNVITPLIAYADRDWNYNTSDATDISTDTGSILNSELRPALRIYNLLVAIENKYDISFSRDFFGKATFQNIFMWLNKRTDDEVKDSRLFTPIYDLVEYTGYEGTNNGRFTFDGEYLQTRYYLYNEDGDKTKIRDAVNIWSIIPSDNTISYDVFIYDDKGNKLNENLNMLGISQITIQNTSQWSVGVDYNAEAIARMKLIIQPSKPMTANVGLDVYYRLIGYPADTVYTYLTTSGNPMDLMIYERIENSLPQLKVLDFISGLIKMFKLVIRPLSDKIFYVDTLNAYYSNGNILNLTEYVDNKSATVEKPTIYKKIDFKHIKSNNVLAKKFRKENDPLDESGYGDLRARYPEIVDKDELKIETPFELIIYEILRDADTDLRTNITIGQSVSLSDDETTLSKNNSGPVLFYNNGLNKHTDYPVKLNFNGSIGTFSYSYNISNINDTIIDQVTDSLCFGSEIEPFTQIDNQISLYSNYWEDWITTIYSLKQRKFTYSAFLPARYVQELSLNDRIIIGNNRYKIQEYTVDINDGTTKFILFNDIFNNSSAIPPTLSKNSYTMNAGARYIDVALNINGTGNWTVTKTDTGDGTGWVDVLTPNGSGSSDLLFYINYNGTVTERTMDINVSINGDTNIIQIYQNGL